MVFIGGGWGPWRRRRRVNPYDPYNQDPYNQDPYNQPYGQQPPGYGYPPPYGYRRGFGGGGCLRDLLLFEGGCCLAEALGCGPQLLLVTPRLVTSRWHRADRNADLPERGAAPTGSWLSRLLISAIAFYQREISPRRAPCCHFSPTCSHYAVEAVQRHGALRGGVLAARRILRCRPGGVGGDDPVP